MTRGLPSSLRECVGTGPADRDELRRLGILCLEVRGVASIVLGEVKDPGLRQQIEAECRRQLGVA